MGIWKEKIGRHHVCFETCLKLCKVFEHHVRVSKLVLNYARCSEITFFVLKHVFIYARSSGITYVSIMWDVQELRMFQTCLQSCEVFRNHACFKLAFSYVRCSGITHVSNLSSITWGVQESRMFQPCLQLYEIFRNHRTTRNKTARF
jgi:hypothetical protein